jgi:hypothetical protein
MSGGLRDRRWRALASFGVTIYAVFLVTTPFAHQDLACHVKTPFHCAACVGSPVGLDLQRPALFGDWSLSAAGRAVGERLLPDGLLLAVISTGRSPPATA